LFTINIQNPVDDLSLKVYDVHGRLVFDTFVAEKSSILVDLETVANGTYYVHLLAEGKKAIVRVSKTK